MADEVLYVSPHADDVAFSAAATVAREVAAGARVTVVTLFEAPQGSGPADFSDRQARRAEDEAFAREFGVTLERGPWSDAIVRRRRYGSPLQLFAPLRPDEAPLVDAVRALVEARVAAGARRVVGPLGVGGHVDHQIAHAACAGIRGAEVSYYEDTPYVLTPYQLPRRLARLGATVEGGAARADRTLQRGSVRGELRAAASTWLHAPLIQDRIGPRLRKLAVAAILTPEWAAWPHRSRPRRRRFSAELAAAGEGVAERKLRAIACYGSQWPLFYRTLDDWRTTLERYGRALGAGGIVERRWREVG